MHVKRRTKWVQKKRSFILPNAGSTPSECGLDCECKRACTLSRFIRQCEMYLCFSLVVKCEDVVSSACLTLSDQKHSMPPWSRALNQVCCLNSGDGPMEPWVGKQEVICLLDSLLWQGEGDRAWRDEQRNKMSLCFLIIKLDSKA